jgi:cytidine deaminase
MTTDPAEGIDHTAFVIGLVRAIGTDLTPIVSSLRSTFAQAGFVTPDDNVIKLSTDFQRLLDEAAASGRGSFPNRLVEKSDSVADYYTTRMDAGDWLRGQFGPDFLAKVAVSHIAHRRQEGPVGHQRGQVFIVDSLMHPAEVELLRMVYGSTFFLVSVYSSPVERQRALTDGLKEGSRAAKIDGTDLKVDEEDDAIHAAQEEANDQRARVAQRLMDRDTGLAAESPGLAPPSRRVSVRKTFKDADLFVDVSGDTGTTDSALNRFICKLFDEPFLTPTSDELGIAHAYVQAQQSASLGRMVGAALCNQRGDMIAVGVNEVPAPGGGHYRPDYDGGSRDYRDHRYPHEPGDERGSLQDSNDRAKNQIFTDLVSRILSALTLEDVEVNEQAGLLNRLKVNPEGAVSELLSDRNVREAELFDMIEFGRAVHAEMSALLSCARNGVSTVGSTLYCTTFPCHECSRHLIAAGVARVVYIEPYPKSRVAQLHADAVDVREFAEAPMEFAGDRATNALLYEPFIGISPRRQRDLYSMTRRKAEGDLADQRKAGLVRPWSLTVDSKLRSSVIAPDPIPRLQQAVMTLEAERVVEKDLIERAFSIPDRPNGRGKSKAGESATSLRPSGSESGNESGDGTLADPE